MEAFSQAQVDRQITMLPIYPSQTSSAGVYIRKIFMHQLVGNFTSLYGEKTNWNIMMSPIKVGLVSKPNAVYRTWFSISIANAAKHRKEFTWNTWYQYLLFYSWALGVKLQLTTIWNIFRIFPQNWLWHFMQIVSNGDNLHWMSKPIFWKLKIEDLTWVVI